MLSAQKHMYNGFHCKLCGKFNNSNRLFIKMEDFFRLPNSSLSQLFSTWFTLKDLPYLSSVLCGPHFEKFSFILRQFCAEIFTKRINSGPLRKPESSWLSRFDFRSHTVKTVFGSSLSEDFDAHVVVCLFNFVNDLDHLSKLLTKLEVSGIRQIILTFSIGMGINPAIKLFEVKKGICSIKINDVIDYDCEKKCLVLDRVEQRYMEIIINSIEGLESVAIDSSAGFSDLSSSKSRDRPKVHFDTCVVNALRKYSTTLIQLTLKHHAISTEMIGWFPNLQSITADQITVTSGLSRFSSMRHIQCSGWEVQGSRLRIGGALSDLTLLTHALPRHYPITHFKIYKCDRYLPMLLPMFAANLLSLTIQLRPADLPFLHLFLKCAKQLEDLNVTQSPYSSVAVAAGEADVFEIIAWTADSPCRATLRSFKCSAFYSRTFVGRTSAVLHLRNLHTLYIAVHLAHDIREVDEFLANLAQLPLLHDVEVHPLISLSRFSGKRTLSADYFQRHGLTHCSIPERWWDWLPLEEGVSEVFARRLVTRDSPFAVSCWHFDASFLFGMTINIIELQCYEALSAASLRAIFANWKHIDVINDSHFALSKKNHELQIRLFADREALEVICAAVPVYIMWLGSGSVVADSASLMEYAAWVFLNCERLGAVHITAYGDFDQVSVMLETIPSVVRTVSLQLRGSKKWRASSNNLDLKQLFGPVPGDEWGEAMSDQEAKLLEILTRFINSRECLREVKLRIRDENNRREFLQADDFDECRRPRLKIELLKDALECPIPSAPMEEVD